MSNSSLQPDQDALRESAIAVITYVRDAMHEGVALLREHNRLLVENQGEHRLESEIQAINENLRHVNDNLERVKRSELTMTIVAPTSAGKSTIINAIAGQDLLPSRNDAMTVLPTEIVFSHEVTRPKLILNKALMTLLLEPWGQLHRKLQRIGLKEAVEQATKNDFPRENVIKEILNSSSVSEVEESNGIQAELIRINDLLRLCGIFGISTGFLSSLPEIPRIKVPFPPRLSSLKGLGLGTLVLVDTPGPSEDKSLDLMNVVKDRLRASSLVLVVVDYTKIGQTDPAKVKKLVDEIAAIKGRDRVYIIVNKIDDRDPNNPQDLTKGQILSLVKTKYKIDNPQNRVFEMSAVQAFLATNFQREKEIYRLTELRGRKSFEALGQKYYSNYWKTKKMTATLEEMQEVANEFLEDSGFVGFIDKAIAPLVKGAATPSMITIKGTLNDITQIFTSFLSCLSKQKGILERDIQRLEIEINQLEIEITAINSHITNIFKVENIKSKAQEELNIILDTESRGLHTKISSLSYSLMSEAKQIQYNYNEAVRLLGIVTIFESLISTSPKQMIRDHHNKQLDNVLSVFQSSYSAITEHYCNQLTDKLLIKEIIERINNNYSRQDELLEFGKN
jgi:predicted GTPase